MSKNITISDVAEALGVSKTTVSRAISGKGRIGEATRKRVMEYITEHDYKPNVIAKGLAQSKTYNICVVMPGNYALVDLPFFQEAIMGIQEIAGMMEYDILLCISQENDVSSLERILSNHKVDGVILLRTFVKDAQIELLSSRNIPFVTAGSTEYKNVIQIDHDHKNACRELTSIILMRGMERIALLGGNESFVVNRSRFQGFEEAYTQMGKQYEQDLIYMNLESKAFMDRAVESAMDQKVDCILCMDDAICSQVLRKLRQEHIKVPRDVRVASFYNSSVLENNIPSITSLSFDARELGSAVCKNLLSQIEEGTVEERTLLSYEVVLKESTK
ncbi:MAG: LacI family transcriptional regulator [Agathobacter sp.]|nr:LacI family transcriptional regulator [Agathobacter sp.]